MTKVKIYTIPTCPYCARAKSMLKDRGYEYEDIDVSDPAELDKLKEKTGRMTVPQVFFDDELIGGSDDLAKWFEEHGDVGKD